MENCMHVLEVASNFNAAISGKIVYQVINHGRLKRSSGVQ
jgi:hypothetical protein